MADYLKENSIAHMDYKNVELLKKFLSTHGQIQSRNRTGLTAVNQRQLAQAVKRSRFMGLLPYISY